MPREKTTLKNESLDLGVLKQFSTTCRVSVFFLQKSLHPTVYVECLLLPDNSSVVVGGGGGVLGSNRCFSCKTKIS